MLQKITSLHRELNSRPSDYKSDALPLCYKGNQCSFWDSNPGPTVDKTDALPTELKELTVLPISQYGT